MSFIWRCHFFLSQRLFLMFSLGILQRNLARRRPKLILFNILYIWLLCYTECPERWRSAWACTRDNDRWQRMITKLLADNLRIRSKRVTCSWTTSCKDIHLNGQKNLSNYYSDWFQLKLTLKYDQAIVWNQCFVLTVVNKCYLSCQLFGMLKQVIRPA